MSCARHILCGRCGREVFQSERKIALNKVWHSFCFSCANCHKLLDSCAVNPLEDEIYCDLCYCKITTGFVEESVKNQTKSTNKTNRSEYLEESRNQTSNSSRRKSISDSPEFNKTNKSYNSQREDTRNRTGNTTTRSWQDIREMSKSQSGRENSRKLAGGGSGSQNVSDYRPRVEETERELYSRNLSTPNSEDPTMYRTILSITPEQLQSNQADFYSGNATLYKSLGQSANEASRLDSTGISTPASLRNKTNSSREWTILSSPPHSPQVDSFDDVNYSSGFDSTGISSPSRNYSSRYNTTDLQSSMESSFNSPKHNRSSFDSTGISSPGSRNRSGRNETTNLQTTMDSSFGFYGNNTSNFDSTGVSTPPRDRSGRNDTTDLRTTMGSSFHSGSPGSPNRSGRYNSSGLLTPDNTAQSRYQTAELRKFDSTYDSQRTGSPNTTGNSSYKTGESMNTTAEKSNFQSSRNLSGRQSSLKITKTSNGRNTLKSSFRTHNDSNRSGLTSISSTRDISSRKEKSAKLKTPKHEESSMFQPSVTSTPNAKRDVSHFTPREKTLTIRTPSMVENKNNTTMDVSKSTRDNRGDSRQTRDMSYKLREESIMDENFCNYPKCPEKCEECKCRHDAPRGEEDFDMDGACSPLGCNLPTPREVSTYYNRRFLERLCNSCFPDYDETKEEREYCRRCRRKVYVMEKRVAAGGVFHDCCFNCFICRKPLSSLLLVVRRGEIYCNNDQQGCNRVNQYTPVSF